MGYSIDLSDKQALVCGASSGIGRAVAEVLAQAGASVTVLARREDKLSALCAELMRLGASDAHLVVCDMDDLDGFSAAIEGVLKARGPIHISVHNSGGPPSGPLLEKTEEEFLGVFRRHQLSAHRLVKHLTPGMTKAGYGRFIQVLSTSAKEPIEGLGLSNLIRAGMVGWSKTLSNELPPKITINNVLPGYTATERLESLKKAVANRTGGTPSQVEANWISGIPEGRLAAPREIGEAVLFLASPMAAYIRGLSLPVEGGRLKGL